MWLSLNWIKDFVDCDMKNISPKNLGVLISLRVAEVEDVKATGDILSQIKVVEVLATKKHPNADKLKLATITDGTQTRIIVCGASNCRAGIKLPFADIGTKFVTRESDGSKSEFTIKKTKIRGVESSGMLCSKSELGLEEKSDGVFELSQDLPNGTKLSELDEFKNFKDIILEIDNKSLTHRPDLWGHYGFAREFATIFDAELKAYPGTKLEISTSKNFLINNELPTLCRRYSALQINNIKVEQSPEWLQQRLNSLGLNSVNNIVDITNYILLELGQPMHAFDMDKLKENAIRIRMAKDGEVFRALDEVEYKLTNNDIVIDNAGEVVALAGVMGGLDTSIDENTVNILLESANFAPASVRKTSNRLGLRSDSSMRFEKSLDPENTVLALKRAFELIKELLPKAQLVETIIDSYKSPFPTVNINTSFKFIKQRLGTDDISNEFIEKKLTSLGFTISGDLTIEVPSWRATKDIQLQEDIVEEVGRLFGYDNIHPETLSVEIKPTTINKARLLERKMKMALTNGFAFSEVMCYPWTGEKQLKKYDLSSEGLMTLKNAVSEDSKFMRSSTVPHIIDAVAENIKYNEHFNLFEFGRVYDTSQMNGILPTEKFRLTAAMVPSYIKNNLDIDAFYKSKAIVLDLLSIAGINNVRVLAKSENELDSWIHPGINADFFRGKQKLAQLYKLHPETAQKNDIRNNVYIFMIYFSEIQNSERKYNYKPVSKFPSVPFDITVLADKKTLASTIESIILRSAKKMIRNIKVFSVYYAEGMDNKSVSFHIDFASANHTLSGKEISEIQDKIIKDLDKAGFPLKT